MKGLQIYSTFWVAFYSSLLDVFTSVRASFLNIFLRALQRFCTVHISCGSAAIEILCTVECFI